MPDEFNYGLTSRKAIYRAYPGCFPATAAIDWEHCTHCGACQSIDGRGIDLINQPQTFEINVGAIVVATGFKPYEPQHGEYGYGELPEVITLAQLMRLLALTPDHAAAQVERSSRAQPRADSLRGQPARWKAFMSRSPMGR